METLQAACNMLAAVLHGYYVDALQYTMYNSSVIDLRLW